MSVTRKSRDRVSLYALKSYSPRRTNTSLALYLRVQWAAVSTCRSVIKTPPQKALGGPRRSRAAIHGHSPGSAGRPPVIFGNDFVAMPQPVLKYHINRRKCNISINIWLLFFKDGLLFPQKSVIESSNHSPIVFKIFGCTFLIIKRRIFSCPLIISEPMSVLNSPSAPNGIPRREPFNIQDILGI